VIIDIVQVTAEDGALPDEFSNRQSFSYPWSYLQSALVCNLDPPSNYCCGYPLPRGAVCMVVVGTPDLLPHSQSLANLHEICDIPVRIMSHRRTREQHRSVRYPISNCVWHNKLRSLLCLLFSHEFSPLPWLDFPLLLWRSHRLCFYGNSTPMCFFTVTPFLL
jgi:hypothetical protein